MKVAIVGCGAMGSIYAGLFAEAGNEVWAVDVWEDHLNEIKSNGLRVEGASGDRIVKNIHVADDSMHDIGQCDLVVLSTKADGVKPSLPLVKSLVGESGFVLAMQNGIGAPRILLDEIPASNVLVGVAAAFGASMKGPGHCYHNAMNQIRVGYFTGGMSEQLQHVVDVWRHAGFNADAYEDIDKLVWEKFICNVAFSGPCTVFDRNVEQMMTDPKAREIIFRCAREAYAVSQAKGLQFSFTDVDEYVQKFSKNLMKARPSMLQDHYAKRRSEIDFINGMVPVLAAEEGLYAPINETISAIVKARETDFSDFPEKWLLKKPI